MQNVGNALGVAIIGVVFFGALRSGFADAFQLSLAALAVILVSMAGLRDSAGEHDPEAPASGEIMAGLRLASDGGELSFFTTVTTFGTAVDITVSELSIEAFFPADAPTAQALGELVAVG